MINVQSPPKYEYHLKNFDLFQPIYGSNLPKIISRSPSVNLYGSMDVQINHRNTPLKRSLSMSTILHGDNASSNSHYIDSLQRFRRNHDAANKEDREENRQFQMRKLMERRNSQIKREEEKRRREDDKLRQMIQKNSKILQSHRQGLFRNNTYINSLGMNPITKVYESNIRGQAQKEIDNEQNARKLVRGRRIQMLGTSGFNPINGSPINNVSNLVALNRQIEGLYSDKLEKMNEKFKINPPSIQEFDRLSASKLFKYH